MPVGVETYTDALRAGSEIFSALREIRHPSHSPGDPSSPRSNDARGKVAVNTNRRRHTPRTRYCTFPRAGVWFPPRHCVKPRALDHPSHSRHFCSESSTPRSSARASVRASSSAPRMRSLSSMVSATTPVSNASDFSSTERVGSSTSRMSSRTSSSGIRRPARYTKAWVPRERASPNRRRARRAPRL